MRPWILVSICFAVCFAVGCGSKSSDRVERARVSGTITLDGRPLTTGKIFFDSRSGEPPVILEIVDGRYEGNAPVGPITISIVSTRQTTMKEELGVDGPGYDEITEIDVLPERYKNMSREVRSGDQNTFDFELQGE
jgi:hypothetical protein